MFCNDWKKSIECKVDKLHLSLKDKTGKGRSCLLLLNFSSYKLCTTPLFLILPKIYISLTCDAIPPNSAKKMILLHNWTFLIQSLLKQKTASFFVFYFIFFIHAEELETLQWVWKIVQSWHCSKDSDHYNHGNDKPLF